MLKKFHIKRFFLFFLKLQIFIVYNELKYIENEMLIHWASKQMRLKPHKKSIHTQLYRRRGGNIDPM